MLIFILLLKLLSAIAALKNNLKIVGAYLLGNLALDIIGQIVKRHNHYPKPYTGVGFILFSITTACYLLNGAWLLWCSGKTVKNITLQQTALLSAATSILGVLYSYPTLSGTKLLTVFYIYYLTLSLTSAFMIFKEMRRQLSLSTGIMLMLSLGCIVEVLMLVIIFGFPYYWLISVCNGIFYLTILGVCVISPKYKHLLKP